MSAWERVGIDSVLALGEGKVAYMAADTNDDEHTAAITYIAALEATLATLGIKIHDNGAVSPTDEGTRK